MSSSALCLWPNPPRLALPHFTSPHDTTRHPKMQLNTATISVGLALSVIVNLTDTANNTNIDDPRSDDAPASSLLTERI